MIDILTLKPEAFGLDISDLSLKIVKLKKKGKFFSLSSFGEAAIPPDVISRGEIKEENILSKIIKEAVNKVKGEKLRTRYAVCSLPEEKAFLQVISLPKIKEEDMGKAVYFEAENYVPLPIGQVYLDFWPIPSSRDSDHADVLIAALPKKIVDSYLSCFKGAGLKPVAFEIESQAIGRALIKEGVSSYPLLIIDFGATRTSFIIFSGRSLRFTTSIQVSSQTFTEAISQNLKIDVVESEKMKREYGLENGTRKKEKGEAGRKSKIFDALTPSLTDLTEQIKKYLDYYQVHDFHEHNLPDKKDVEKIMISGGGANLKGLSGFLSAELKIPVELANPWVNILPYPIKEIPDMPFDKSLGFTTALGLAIRGNNN